MVLIGIFSDCFFISSALFFLPDNLTFNYHFYF
jgi:hypothetical protein